MVRFLKTMEKAKPSAFLVISMLACLVSFSMQDCARPTDLQDNVLIDPDRPSYLTWQAYTASCEEGYDIAGPTTIYCYDSGWNPAPSSTSCQAGGCSKPNITDTNVVITPDNDSYNSDEVVTFSCSVEGYTIEGPYEATCGYDGEFNLASLPTCKVGCSAPTHSNGTRSYENGEIESFSCGEGYELITDEKTNGSLTVTSNCANGNWRPDVVCQEPTGCRAPPYLVNVKYKFPPDDGGVYPIYSKLDMQCIGQKDAWGPLYSYCNKSKQWEPDPQNLKCYDRCAKPTFDDTRVTVTSLRSGRTDDAYYNHTDTVKFSCPGGIFVDGPWRASCKNGTWSTPIGGYRPLCRGNCTAPVNTLNAGELFQHGQAYTFQCDPTIPGLVRLGGPRAFCNDGTWKPNLKCRLKTEL